MASKFPGVAANAILTISDHAKEFPAEGIRALEYISKMAPQSETKHFAEKKVESILKDIHKGYKNDQTKAVEKYVSIATSGCSPEMRLLAGKEVLDLAHKLHQVDPKGSEDMLTTLSEKGPEIQRPLAKKIIEDLKNLDVEKENRWQHKAAVKDTNLEFGKVTEEHFRN
jgi:hypothetical protein